jgi:hypothetical protein
VVWVRSSSWRRCPEFCFYEKGFNNTALLIQSRSNFSYVCWFSQFLATDPEVPGSIPAIPDFLWRSGSGTGFTQHRENNWPPLWSSGQSSWLQIQRFRVRFRRYQIFYEEVALERGSLSIVRTIDRLCGLVVRVRGYRSRGSGFDSRQHQIFYEEVALERGSLSIVRTNDRLCGLVVRARGYRSRGLGFDSRRYQIFRAVVGLERGPLSLVSTIEEHLTLDRYSSLADSSHGVLSFV